MENTELQKMEDLKNLNERYSKWQMKQIDHLTFNINLILTLSLGILVYLLNLKNTSIPENETAENILNFQTNTILLVSIVTIGVIINILRYIDFKYTKDKIEIRKQLLKNTDGIQKLNTKLNCYKCITKILGCASKCLFFIMALTFIITIWKIILNE